MITKEDVFNVIDQRAEYLTKDDSGKVYWHIVKPEPDMIRWNQYWWSTGEGGELGYIELEEFQGKEWFECIVKKGYKDDWEPVEKQIGIDELVPLLKRGWVAMDSDNQWHWYEMKPVLREYFWDGGDCFSSELYVAFNIAPFDGDWKDSLIEIK